MTLLTRVTVFMFCINIMLTLAGFSLGGNDIVSSFFDISGDKVNPNNNLNTTLPKSLEQGSIGSGTSGFNFIDGLRMVAGFLFLIVSVIIAPIYWGFFLGFPIWLQMIFIIPEMLFILGIINMFRGISA